MLVHWNTKKTQLIKDNLKSISKLPWEKNDFWGTTVAGSIPLNKWNIAVSVDSYMFAFKLMHSSTEISYSLGKNANSFEIYESDFYKFCNENILWLFSTRALPLSSVMQRHMSNMYFVACMLNLCSIYDTQFLEFKSLHSSHHPPWNASDTATSYWNIYARFN